MNISNLVKQLSIEEKALLISGGDYMSSALIESLDIPQKYFSDGPHGVRKDENFKNCTSFPNLCNLGASFNKKTHIKLAKQLPMTVLKTESQ